MFVAGRWRWYAGSVVLHAAGVWLLAGVDAAPERTPVDTSPVTMEVSFAEVPAEREAMPEPMPSPMPSPMPQPMPMPMPRPMPQPMPRPMPMPQPMQQPTPSPMPQPMPMPQPEPAAAPGSSGGGWLALRTPRRAGAEAPHPAVPGAAEAARSSYAAAPDDDGARLVTAAPTTTRRAEADPTSSWVPDGRGGFEVTRTGFVALVDRDGRVRFRDRPSIDPYTNLPCVDCLRRKLGRTLVDWAKDPYAYTRDLDAHLGGPAVPGEPQAMTYGLTRPDVPGEPEDFGFTIPFVTGRFDATDAAMRAHGEDPYRYEKQRFLDESAEEREKMAAHHAGRARLETVAALHDRLDALWRRADLPVAERRRQLFALWDECAESGEPALVHAGERARAAIVGFVRAHLPRGHADAYDDAELDALNRTRTSTAAFRPYDDEE